jgi:hypothetical protein
MVPWSPPRRVLGAGLLFCLFPRAWFRAPLNTGKFGSGDLVSEPLVTSQQLAEVGASSRRDLLQLSTFWT